MLFSYVQLFSEHLSHFSSCMMCETGYTSDDYYTSMRDSMLWRMQ